MNVNKIYINKLFIIFPPYHIEAAQTPVCVVSVLCKTETCADAFHVRARRYNFYFYFAPRIFCTARFKISTVFKTSSCVLYFPKVNLTALFARAVS